MKLDQFTSRVKRATKVRYGYEHLRIGKVLLITDRDAEGTAELLEKAKRLLRAIDEEEQVQWEVLDEDAYDSGQGLLDRIEASKPDLVVTQRGLKERGADLVYSLGAYLDVLTQVCVMPVLVLPGDDELSAEALQEGTPQVMVVTDHLTGEDALVNWGVRFVLGEQGDLFLTHVEDDHVFERYMSVIEKLPSIDTETARTDIKAQLLKEPEEFIDSCRQELESKGLKLKLHSIVQLGHSVTVYKDLAESHGVDLLVFATKDETQVAMHGVAYGLAVELKRIPLLLV
jgi:nucleotide-binding universal stress UspA family protein